MPGANLPRHCYLDRNAVVLALPRGGVLVAGEISAALHAPLDLVLVRKLGLPIQPELAMGAVVNGAAPLIVRNDDVIALAQISEADFVAVRDHELAEIDRRRRLYLGNRVRPEIASAEHHDPFGAIGLFYVNIRQVSDAEVIDWLDRFSRRASDTGQPPGEWAAGRTWRRETTD